MFQHSILIILLSTSPKVKKIREFNKKRPKKEAFLIKEKIFYKDAPALSIKTLPPSSIINGASDCKSDAGEQDFKS